MNHDEISTWSRWHLDARNSVEWRRQSREEREWQVPHRVAKLGTMITVPGVNRIEASECFRARAFDDADEVESGVGDRADSIRETDQWKHWPWSPHLGVISARSFQRGQRQDHVADGARANQQPFHFSPYSRRPLLRSTIRASSAARSRVISPSLSISVSAIPKAVRPA